MNAKVVLLAAFARIVFAASVSSSLLSVDADSRSPWTWSRVEARGVRPAARQGHAAVEVGSRIYVIGGCVQDVQCYNDIHIFNTETLEWSQEPYSGDAPEPRGGHSATLLGAAIYVYGGASSMGAVGDTYRFDLVKRRWTRGIAVSGGVGPGRRTNHAAVADSNGRIYIFGGYSAEGTYLSDLWLLSMEGFTAAGASAPIKAAESFAIAWSLPASTGQIPAARSSHSLTLVDQRLVVFGGYLAEGQVANDVHIFDLDDQVWKSPSAAPDAPAPRQGHSAVRHGRDVVVAGGCDVSREDSVCYNDAWTLSLVDMLWTRRSSDEITWFPREGHSATFSRGRMFVFGGCDLSLQCYDDVAALDSQDPCPANCGGHGECAVGAPPMGSFCRCMSGFMSHDCMQPVTCPGNCGGHGSCGAGGQCICDNGWGGPSCETALPCPWAHTTDGFYACANKGRCMTDGMCQCFRGYGGPSCEEGVPLCPGNCSGHGVCSSLSTCICEEGWVGPACHQPALPQQPPLVIGSRSAAALTKPFATSLSSLESMWSKGREVLSLSKRQSPAASSTRTLNSKSSQHVPTNRDFGVETVNPGGHTGVINTNTCPESCNFRGICQDDICYCQPGFMGRACESARQSTVGTYSIGVSAAIAGTCFVVTLLTLLILLFWQWRQKSLSDQKFGYIV
mmetsp:Transcript_15136/g.35474  ORF Transcript_15136/g.35474 Transcript_15136/m.35474 type:complete len:676 (-) Transcript_15136:68-2095(-)